MTYEQMNWCYMLGMNNEWTHFMIFDKTMYADSLLDFCNMYCMGGEL